VCPRLNNKTNSQNNKQPAQTTRTRILRNKRTHGPAQRGGMATPHDEKEREYLRRMEAEAAPSRSPPMTRKSGGRGEEESKERTGGGARGGGRRRLFRRKAKGEAVSFAPPSQETNSPNAALLLYSSYRRKITRCLQIEPRIPRIDEAPLPLSRSSSSRGRSGMRDKKLL
jgi:hypothetical protein